MKYHLMCMSKEKIITFTFGEKESLFLTFSSSEFFFLKMPVSHKWNRLFFSQN